ncbi:hypothetical protein AURDEDRAFT_170989 [Auricularia subglabra TFB-10046 SS5]|nr:hypothetical protein AURDEDRAFT_170989 [Auricularia subglabra TFB-10046 SS5]
MHGEKHGGRGASGGRWVLQGVYKLPARNLNRPSLLPPIFHSSFPLHSASHTPRSSRLCSPPHTLPHHRRPSTFHSYAAFPVSLDRALWSAPARHVQPRLRPFLVSTTGARLISARSGRVSACDRCGGMAGQTANFHSCRKRAMYTLRPAAPDVRSLQATPSACAESAR